MNVYLEKFTDVYEKLETLPEEISALDDDILDLSTQASSLRQKLDEYEMDIVAQAGGIKALGSNEAQRKEQKAILLKSNTTYRRAIVSLNLIQDELNFAEKERGKFERQYAAVCYQARLLAGYMAFVGATSTMPVPQQSSTTELEDERADIF